MRCPDCNSIQVTVINSRRAQSYARGHESIVMSAILNLGNVVGRLRECRDCCERWWTVEQVFEYKGEPGLKGRPGRLYGQKNNQDRS